MTDYDPMRKWIQSLCLCLCVLAVATAGYGQNQRPTVKELKVLGTAVIHNKNQASARKNAVNDALASAVGQVVSSMLTSETVVRRFQLINDQILSKKDIYVQNYRVLTEAVSGSRIRAFVQVEVSVDQISQDLSGLGLAKAGVVYPRILFMMAERNLQKENFTFWWGNKKVTNRTITESAMVGAFQRSGFKVAPTPHLPSSLGLPLHPQQAKMIALAGQLGADVLIAGSGTVTPAPGTNETTKTVEAIVNAKAFKVKTGQTIGQSQQKKALSVQNDTKGVNKALSNAGAAAGKDLSRKVMVAWQQDLNTGTVVDVMVEGTDGQIASFVRLRKTITSLSGVRELKMKAMSADRGDMAVHYQGSARSLADALLLKTFDGFSIDIFEVTANEIHIRLIH